ncbi:MAG: acetyl-CoA carboxylase biotin carboxyl carrier protein [Ignavibacteriales bacterium]|nr:acetyl-CoA carboxylase biotin carboxyl carrier protein [Ignavibacteriales bacterium]
MDLSYIKKIIKLVENSNVDEVEIEEEGKKIRVARNRVQNAFYAAPPALQFPVSQPLLGGVAQPQPKTESAAPSTPASEKQFHEVRSPIVGTFYRAPSPDADPYVEIGQSIKSGTVLCIVEAMKLMNEIESDVDGTIAKIMVENGKPVEYNQVLFLVDKG